MCMYWTPREVERKCVLHRDTVAQLSFITLCTCKESVRALQALCTSLSREARQSLGSLQAFPECHLCQVRSSLFLKAPQTVSCHRSCNQLLQIWWHCRDWRSEWGESVPSSTPASPLLSLLHHPKTVLVSIPHGGRRQKSPNTSQR